MKKKIGLIMAAALVLAVLTACGTQKPDQTGSTPAPAPTTAVTPGTAGPQTPEDTQQSGQTPGQTPEPGQESEPENTEAQAGSFDEFFKAVQADYELPMLGEMDADMIKSWYPGIEELDAKAVRGYMPMISSVAYEFIFAELRDEKSVSEAEELFEKRIREQADGGAWYPESMAAWGKAEVVTEGNFAAMIAAGDDSAAIAERFRDFVKAQ